MARRKILPDISLRTKVLVPMIAVLVLMLAVTLWFVNHRLNRQIKEDALDALDTCSRVFSTLQASHLDYLRKRFQSLANEPKNRAAFGTLDYNTIQNQLRSIYEDEASFQPPGTTSGGMAFVLFTPESEMSGSRPMLQPSTAPPSVVPASEANIIRAVQAGAGTATTISDVICVGGHLYNIVSIQVVNPGQIPIGVLTVGETIGGQVAQEYRKFTGKPIVFVADGKPAASTLSEDLENSALQQAFQDLAGGSQEATVSLADGKDHYFCGLGRFTSSKDDGMMGYLLFSSYDPPESTLETQKLLLIAGFATILGGSVIVWFFVKRATQPLIELRDSAEAVGRGDFSRRVTVPGRDECGELAVAFNRMTENVQQAQAELQKTVNTLKTTQAQLVQSEKLSAVGEFVAGVAHELNNPLAAVMGFSELLKDAPVEEKYRRHLDMIFKSAVRCRKIVQSLLSFARRHQPERKPVSVNHLIDEVLEIVAYQLRTSNVEVVTRFAADLPLVLADGHQIQQVILNLVNNARQAIEAQQNSGRITVSTERNDAFVRISIKDNGPGISPENLKRIFDPFFTTKEVGKGTGLGLSLCYGLIKEHGGSIAVTSKPGDGAAFTIELPATIGSVTATAPTVANPAENQNEGAGKKVLLVDDEEMLLEMVRDGLKRCGYEVVIASNGEAALREMHQHRPDIICTDLKMPGLTGRQLYDWIRTSHPAAARRVIFMTGDIINESLQLFLDQEQLICLNKPFALPDLRQAIKNTLAETNGH